jgi:hypothetical protein
MSTQENQNENQPIDVGLLLKLGSELPNFPFVLFNLNDVTRIMRSESMASHNILLLLINKGWVTGNKLVIDEVKAQLSIGANANLNRFNLIKFHFTDYGIEVFRENQDNNNGTNENNSGEQLEINFNE